MHAEDDNFALMLLLLLLHKPGYWNSNGLLGEKSAHLLPCVYVVYLLI